MSKQHSFLSDNQYFQFLDGLKQRIRSAQIRAALAVNQEMILLYWQIGQDILQQQRDEGWGTKVIDRIARDLKQAFPEMKGFSPRNIKYMRALAEAYPDEQIVLRLIAQIPWGHNQSLLNKLDSLEQRLWYAQKAIENGWNRNTLELQIKSDLFSRQGGALTNFNFTLPESQSDLAQSLLKSEYNLEFLELKEKAHERELEQALVNHMQRFLLELGVGFSFMGHQYRLEVEGDEFFVDLLFYHVRLRSYVAYSHDFGSQLHLTSAPSHTNFGRVTIDRCDEAIIG